MANIKIYSLPTWPHCHHVKEFLSDKNLEFTDFNVAEDKVARDEMITLTNQRAVPVIVIEDQVIIGFDQQKIDEILSKQWSCAKRKKYHVKKYCFFLIFINVFKGNG